jgi:hypothetical protein
MQLVIRVDLDKAKQPLPEIFRLIGNGASTDESMQDPVIDATGRIQDNRSRVIGEWEIEENPERENVSHPLESAFRAAATARYATHRQIEVDRFATVSMANDGAYVQGWLFVPRAELASRDGIAPPAKPPQSVIPMRSTGTKAG